LAHAGGARSTEAEARGFALCVQGLQRTLRATPAGWALVAWLAHGRVPDGQLLAWLGTCAAVWAVNLWLLRGVAMAGSELALHRGRLWLVAALVGLCWGLMPAVLMTHDRLLGAWLLLVLCGALWAHLPALVTCRSAFHVFLGAVWLPGAASALYLWPQQAAAPQLLLGLSACVGLLIYSFRLLSARAMRGVQLQLDNAALAGQLREALTHMAYPTTTDALTGQMNRRALDAVMHSYTAAAQGRRFRFSVLMLDIDHFKQVVDTHGQPVGDQALAAVAARIVAQLRGGDSCARYGGEAFVVLLPDASLARALEVAQRIRRQVAASPLATEPPVQVSVSIGVAQHHAGMTAQSLLAAADEAVYVAKREGHNQVRAAADAVDAEDSAPASDRRHR
jgi:diguanylate cyclase (GGDEF)-like protein